MQMPPPPSRPPEPEITWTVTMPTANLILSILAQQPFEKVADLIVDLRNQASVSIQQFQLQQGMPNGNGLPPIEDARH